MKKLILPIIVLLTVVFFLSQKVNAQTDPECYRVYQNEGYKCLQTRTKCIQSCSSINNLKTCHDSCSAQDKVCSNQASADLKACLAAIPKEGTKVSTEANAQPKNVTCAEWKNILGTDKCKYAVVTSTVIWGASNPRSAPPNSIWCSNTVDVGDTYINLPVDYKYATSEEKCIFDAQADAYEKQTEKSADRASQTTSQETKTPKQTPPVFIGEWFSRFSKVTEALTALPEAMVDVVYEDKLHLAGDFPKLSKMSLEDFYQGHWYPDEDDSVRPATITAEDEQEAWEEFLPNYIPGEENVTVIKGQSEIKMPTSSDFIPIPSKSGDTLKVTYLDSTVRSTSDMVQLGYTWSADSGSVINVPKWSEVKFREPVEAEGFTSHTVELGQGEIEVKVRNNKPAENQFGVDAGWLGVTVSRTHFWISQSQDKKLAVIGVYEGEVEVNTRDGQAIKVKPDGGKPGVVVVSRKLSIIKLALTGVILAVIVGGAIWVLKRKFALNKISKRKK